MNSLFKVWYKCLHWEYWHTRTIYFPALFAWMFLAVKAKSIFFFSGVNPSFKFGGFVMASKMDIYKLLPAQWIPKGMLWEKSSPIDTLETQMAAAGLTFPIILKPDVGLKGLGVLEFTNLEALSAYLKETSSSQIIQEKIPYSKEVGLFYMRYPNDPKGICTGMARKDFLRVCGDGKHSIRELVQQHPRALLKWDSLHQMDSLDFDEILAPGKEKVLVPFGSHTRGAEFVDVSEHISQALCNAIDEIAQQVPGFYYGRFDIMYNHWEELLAGKNFSVIELNGAASEPIHMYDSRHSYGFALKEIYRHWKHMQRISTLNRKTNPPKYSVKEMLCAIRENVILERRLKREMGL